MHGRRNPLLFGLAVVGLSLVTLAPTSTGAAVRKGSKARLRVPTVTTTVTPATTMPATTTTTSTTLAPTAPFVPTPITWTTCGLYDCARVVVPRSYDQSGESGSSGGNLTLQVIRSRATSADRIGTLFMYPGGPGGSSVSVVQSLEKRLPAEVRARFDLIGVDSRGLPRSTPFRCGDITDLSTNREARLRYTAACKLNASQELLTTDSETNARDMDTVRAAMGEPTITFVGYSYGGQLGRAYATLFPERVRAMVLDSPTDPATAPEQRIIDQLEARESTLASFLQYCTARPSCAFNDGTDLSIRYTALATQVAAFPVAGNGYTLDRALFELLVDNELRTDSRWSTLGLILRDLITTGSLTRVNALVSSLDLSSADTAARDNALAVYLSTVCRDGFMPTTQAELDDLSGRVATVAPHFVTRLDILTAGGSCLNWPVPPRPARTAPTVASGPTLVISTVWDLTTPHEWSQQLAQSIGASIIPVDRTGHGVFPGLSCVDTLTTRFLVDLSPPPFGTRCF